jgi:hypothetical protein
MARDPRLDKPAVELRIFEALAPLIGLEIVPFSIQQPDPPDIVCLVQDQGSLAVELVAIDDDATRKRLNNMANTKEAWDRALQQWPQHEKGLLVLDLKDAYVSVVFSKEPGMRDRSKLFKALQGWLLTHSGFSGRVELGELELMGVEQLAIYRNQKIQDGPGISSPSAGYWLPPQVSKIVEKLRDKDYPTDIPLELFVYATHDEPNGAVGSLEAIQAAVAEHLPTSRFRRVHLFHVGFRQHIWSSDLKGA